MEIILRADPLILAGMFLSESAAFAADRMMPSDIRETFFNGKPFTASIAIAREMVGFIWSIACTVQSAPKTA